MSVRSLLLLILSAALIAGGLFIRSQYSKEFHPSLIAGIQNRISDELKAADEEAAAIIKEGLAVNSQAWDKADHFFIEADSNHVTAWNRNDYLPAISFLSPRHQLSFVQTARGDFLIKNWPTTHQSSLYLILPLVSRYPIINNFLSTQFNKDIFKVNTIQLLSPLSEGEPVFVDNEMLFKVRVSRFETHESLISFFLILTGVVIFILWLWRLKAVFENKDRYALAFGMLVLGMLVIRVSMIALSFPALFSSSDIFDPKLFASSSLNASLGDLFLNALALFVIVVYLFVNFDKIVVAQWILQKSAAVRFVMGLLCIFLCFLSLLFPYDFVESIYHNSTLNLDLLQSLSFDSVRIIAITSVMIGCACSFLVIHLSFSLANHLFEKKIVYFFLALAVAAAVFFLLSYIFQRDLRITLFLGLIYFGVLKLTKLNKGTFKVSFQLFIYLIFSLAVFSFQNAWTIRLFYKERQIQDQLRFAKDFLTERDELGEYLLDQAKQRIEQDQFIQTRMASLFLSKSAVEEKINRVYLNNYFDRYEIAIRAISSAGQDSALVNTTQDIHASGDYLPTGYNGIYYAKASNQNTIKRYHVSIPVFYLRPVGRIELDLSLKRVIPDNVYPELLVDNRFNQIYRNRDFSYAIFSGDKLVSSFGPVNYEKNFPKSELKDEQLYSAGFSDDKYYHIAIEDADGSVAVVSAAIYPSFFFITNFSFWFGLGLLLLFTGQLIIGAYAFFSGQQVNYSTRIQLFIFLSFLLPVLAVSITTFSLIGRTNEESIKKDYLDRSKGVAQGVATLVPIDSNYNESEISKLEQFVSEAAVSSKTDISIYSADGRLLATSQAALFDNQLISPLLSRQAFRDILIDQETQTVTNEQIGKLAYSCAYTAVLSPETGELKAIIGLPFFESASFLQKSQSLIISNILIVFVLVFILFSILSFWASSHLTFPIRFITKALGQTTLTGDNKPVQWKSSDEIGTLVKEYNRMVDNLQESKLALARTEKESAWREMAKQVAHEIKNPLTPMKLTLQQMEQQIRQGNVSDEKSRKSVEVLLKQVDILNEIATSFSTFASMPSLSPQKVSINDVLQQVVSLFQAESTVRIAFEKSEEFSVEIDQKSFTRAISNIIINAIQAKREHQSVIEIEIKVTREQDQVVIAIRDNGRGIPEEARDRIFQPQFTTKKTGSGLGLAMTKQIIQQSNGKIWFESDEKTGTTFFIELPI